MADLRVNVPLAMMENEEDEDPVDYEAFEKIIRESAELQTEFQENGINNNNNSNNNINSNNNNNNSLHPRRAQRVANGHEVRHSASSTEIMESFGEEPSMRGSLEDLVSSFDETISKVFKNYDENTDDIAPVQVRTEEEIMNESQ